MKGPRESVDSAANPDSTPIILCCDVTGSMGILATEIVKKGLGVIMQGIYDHKPVPDPHILLAAVGDAACDRAPLQVTQFEADNKALVPQIEKIWIEGGGGGNMGESYPLMWWFAANKTKCDSYAKRGRKGYLFTIGDECPLAGRLEAFTGTQEAASLESLLASAQAEWEVFHLIVPTDATKHQGAVDVWKRLLGERAVLCPDASKLGETVVALISANEGMDASLISKTWGSDVAAAVAGTSALAKVLPGKAGAIEAI